MKFRFFFVALCLTAFLVLTIYLRTSEDRIFYQTCQIATEQGRLKQQLWQKQLDLEVRINPAAVSDKIKTEPKNI